MKKLIKCAVYTILVLVSFGVSSCSKDNSNPVEPTVEVKIEGSLNLSYNAAYFVEQYPHILKADLLFDGNVIASQNYTYPVSGSGTLSSTVSSVKKGAHTISFRITNQDSSPHYYEADGSWAVGNANNQLAEKYVLLATGESISYSITL